MVERLLDALAERIARGERIAPDEFTRLGEETSSPRMADGLFLLSKISDYHSALLREGGQTLEETLTEGEGRWGRLELRERLGRGGFGEVYRAYDPDLQREVALKLFRADRVSRDTSLLAEARKLAKLRHENVVSVYGVETHEGRSGYWMELVEGRTLEEQLEQDGPLGAEEARAVGRSLCRALAAVHAHALVHRDIKTTNVMRERGGRLVLMDFGTVADVDTHDSGHVSGTPAYMAPEILAGEAPSIRSDIFSLGVLLFHLTTGSYPREAKDFGGLRRADASGQRKRMRDLRPDLPAEFCDVVERAVATDPDERFASAGELELALGGSTERRSSKFLTRRAAMAAALATLVIAFFALRGSFDGAASMLADARVFTLRGGTAVAIGDDSAVSVGSPLWMEFRPSQEAYVYILNRDATGEVNLLFPLPGYDTQNPLAAETKHELPGRMGGVRKGWVVSSEGGREEILLIASARALDAFEQSLGRLPAAGSNDERIALALGSNQVRELVRGISGTLDLPERPAADDEAGSVFAAAERLGASSAASGEVWVRRITLRHE